MHINHETLVFTSPTAAEYGNEYFEEMNIKYSKKGTKC